MKNTWNEDTELSRIDSAITWAASFKEKPEHAALKTMFWIVLLIIVSVSIGWWLG